MNAPEVKIKLDLVAPVFLTRLDTTFVFLGNCFGVSVDFTNSLEVFMAKLN